MRRYLLRQGSGGMVPLTALLILAAAGAFETQAEYGGRSSIDDPSAPGTIGPIGAPRHPQQRPLLCTVGRFRVEGGPLLGRRDAAETDVVSLIGSHVSIEGLFPATLATLLPLPDGTRVIARWRAGPGLPRGAHLNAKIDEGTCSNLEGSFLAPGVAARRDLRARLVRCDEHGEREGRETEECNPLDRLALHFQRWRTHFRQRAYPSGFIAKDALNKAHAETLLAPIAFDRWVSIGPAPIVVVAEGGDKGDKQSGRVDAVATDPSNLAHWLIGAAGGGVWETTDGGATWDPRTDDQPSLASSAIAFAPGFPSVVYAGTGHYSMAGNYGLPGAGLLKSQDGGHTWTLLAASTFAGLSFPAIQVSGADPDTLVAATTSGIEGFFGGYTAPGAPEPGVYRSSTGGASWSLTLPGQATDVVAHPADFMRQYAALRSYSFSEVPEEPGGKLLWGGGVSRSTDGGQTWTAVAGPWNVPPGQSGEIRLAIAPSEPDVLYVSVRNADSPGIGFLLGLWVTRNAWAPTPTWIKVPETGQPPGGYLVGRPNHMISVHPTDPSIVYATGIALWKFAAGAWTNIATPANTMYADQNALAWAGPRLVVGNDGGVFSHDEAAGGPWTNHNTDLAITQLYGGASHPAVPGAMMAGAQDNGVLMRAVATPPVWEEFAGADGIGAQPGAAAGHWMYWTQQLALRRTFDDGVKTHQPATINLGDKEFAPFLARVVRCPANADTVLAGSKSLWRTDSFFSTVLWSTIPWAANGPSLGPEGGWSYNFVSAIAFAPSDPSCQTYAFGGDKGRLLLTNNGGATWINLDPTNQVPGRYVTGLAFSPTSADTLYVTLSGFDESTPGEPGHVFKATGATTGAVWTNVSPPVNLPHNVVVAHPTVPDTVYVGTDLGLWISHDGGASWAHAGPASGLPNVAVLGIDVDVCGVTAFTFGRGAFRNAVPFVCP